MKIELTLHRWFLRHDRWDDEIWTEDHDAESLARRKAYIATRPRLHIIEERTIADGSQDTEINR
jgi:hypothetical protein